MDIQEKIEGMTAAGAVARNIRNELRFNVEAGVTTAQLDRLAFLLMQNAEAESQSFGHKMPDGSTFPGYACWSKNDVVCHGPPDNIPLEVGDILTIDVCLKLGDWCADTACTIVVDEHAGGTMNDLTIAAMCAMHAGIGSARAGAFIGSIAAAQEASAEALGFKVCRIYHGHGIGETLHEKPIVPAYGTPGKGYKLRKGDAFTVEPMLIDHIDDEVTHFDNVPVAKGPVAMFEHTVIIDERGVARILT